jgi:hypothetical protein
VGEDVLIAEDKKRREEQLGPDTATIEYRKKIMDERANAPDEQRRQMGMRLMEFGANWASTPGAPLVAGMRALKEGLPGFMEDTKANKKAMKDIDASIYALDRAARLEDEGYLDRATAKKEKARELFAKAAPAVIDASVKKETLTLQKESNADQKDYQQGVLANQAAELAQRGKQFDITSSKPTEASMKQAYIDARIKAGDTPDEAYVKAEAAGSSTKDASLGYEVALAKDRYNAAVEAASGPNTFGLSQPEKDARKAAVESAATDLTRVQNFVSHTGNYGVIAPPTSAGGPTASTAMPGLDSMFSTDRLEAERKRRIAEKNKGAQQ